MFAESLNHHSPNHQTGEKMITGAFEGKLVVTKLLLKQGMNWSTIADLMDMTWEQIASVQSDFY